MSSSELADRLADRPAGLPVAGYRGWRLLWNGELRAVGRGGITWMPGVNTAACAHGFAHQAPDLDCDCGLYADHHPGGRSDREDEIVGAVVAWGQLHVYRDGFRAEHARVVALARRPGTDRRRRTAEEAAAQRYGASLVDRGELELVAGEHGDPVDPAAIAQLDTQVVPVPDGGRARTRREILTDSAYDTIARPMRAVPALRTLLLCAHAYGLAVSLYLWALLVIACAKHPPAATGKAIVFNHMVMPAVFASIPALAAGAIHAVRRLEPSRTGPPPWPARLLWPLMLALTIALPWLPARADARLAAVWLLAVGAGTVLAATVAFAIQSGALELIAAMTPGIVAALALANNGASAGAVVCAVCLTAVVTIVYGERRGVLPQ